MAGPTPARKPPAKKATPAGQRRQPAAAQPAPEEEPGEPQGPFQGFDLDALDKRTVLPDVTDQLFEFRVNGQVFRMIDPRDVDWKEVLDGITNPILFMRLAMVGDGAADRFVQTPLPGWKLSALFDNWQAHYSVAGFSDLNLLLTGRSQDAGDGAGE